MARWSLGHPGWREDLDNVAMARSTDPLTRAMVVGLKYGPAVPNGVLQADDSAVCEIEEALQNAEGLGDDYTLALGKHTLGLALSHLDAAADRQRGLELLAQVRDMCLHQRYPRSELPMFDLLAARKLLSCREFSV